ncbi:MAG: DciA family protein [Syntrophales bacterium]|jgi:hypothetical protein
MQKLSDIFPIILKNHNLCLGLEDKKLHTIWNSVVGPTVAAQTCPEKIKGNTLCVFVSTSVWKHQLHFLKDEILKKWNRLPNQTAIADIRFSIGPIGKSLKHQHPATPIHVEISRLRDQDKRFIEDSLQKITDPELKETLKRLMVREISRRRRLLTL